MKPILLSAGLILACCSAFCQSEFYNDGAQVTVQDGALLYVQGEVVNANSGTVTNDGTIQVTGDFTNNATYQYDASGARTVVFSGVGNTQNVTGNMAGTGVNQFYNMTVQKGAGEKVNLNGTSANVAGTLTFVNGIIQTNPAQEVYVNNNSAGAIVGHQTPNGTGIYASDNYVQGNLSRDVTAGNAYDYPVGDASNDYNPIVFSINSGSGKVGGSFITDNIGTINYQNVEDCSAYPPGTTNQWIEFYCMAGEGYWDFNGPAMSYDLVVHPNGTNLNGCGGPWYRALMTSANPNGHSWTAGEVNTGTVCLGGYNYFAVPGYGYNAFGNYASSSGPTGLPIELTYLHAKPVNNTYILVDWQTASEVDNQGFELQRSINGVTFEDMTWVNGAGNSTSPKYYSYDDREVQTNQMYYYRLKQIDFSGKYTYSPIVQAMITSDEVMEIGDFYPNPANNVSALPITIGTDTKMNVTVYNTLGQGVLSNDVNLSEGLNTVSFDFNKLPSATYQAVLSINGVKYTRPLVITK